VFVRGTEHFVARVDGSREWSFAPGLQIDVRSISPDETRLAVVAANDEGRIVGGTVKVDGTGLRLFEGPHPTLNMACGWWGPDRIACEGWDDEDPLRSGIYTVRASDGGGLRRLTRDRDYPCAYSPDGTRLAFIRVTEDIGTNEEAGNLLLVDADGGKPQVLLEGVGESGMACDWSPDGTTILAGRSDGSIVLVSPGGEATPFVAAGIDGYAEGFRWSPDGSRFLFSMNLDGQFDVYTVGADGSDLRRITESHLDEFGEEWLRA
jgi:WD40 repeat protein